MAVKSSILPRLSGVLWLMFGTALLLAQGSSNQTISVDKSFHNREIKARVGTVVCVKLEEQGATGYQWKIQNLDSAFFEVLAEGTPEAPSPTGLEGAPVMKTWSIRAKKEGKSELRFLRYRSWEGAGNASDSFVLKVRIIP